MLPAVAAAGLTVFGIVGIAFAQHQGAGLPGGPWVALHLVVTLPGQFVLSVLDSLVRCRGASWAVWLVYGSSIVFNTAAAALLASTLSGRRGQLEQPPA